MHKRKICILISDKLDFRAKGTTKDQEIYHSDKSFN